MKEDNTKSKLSKQFTLFIALQKLDVVTQANYFYIKIQIFYFVKSFKINCKVSMKENLIFIRR